MKLIKYAKLYNKRPKGLFNFPKSKIEYKNCGDEKKATKRYF